MILPGLRKPACQRHAFDTIAFARDRLAFEPGPDQLLALDPTIRRGLLNCCRQWGKSTTVAIRAVHHAIHTPDSLTIVASPSERQSAEFVRKAAAFLRELEIPPRGDGDNVISLAFPNGARIVGLPSREGTTRGPDWSRPARSRPPRGGNGAGLRA